VESCLVGATNIEKQFDVCQVPCRRENQGSQTTGSPDITSRTFKEPGSSKRRIFVVLRKNSGNKNDILLGTKYIAVIILDGEPSWLI